MKNMDLTIQIVNFRSRHYLKECLFSIGKSLPAGFDTEIIVINNDEEPLGDIFSGYGDGFFGHAVEINENIGFGKAHNAGFRQSRGKYILFLNPDTKIAPLSLEKLLGAFAKDENVGVAGPLLVDSSGEVQADCFGTNRTPLSTIGGKIFSRKKMVPLAGDEIFETDWVSGGAMMVRRDVFEGVGGFDENYFMYFEDVDLCSGAKKIGQRTVVHPAVRIFHESGRSFESEREKKKYYYASQEYFLRKHFGRGWAWLVKILRLPYYIKNIYFSR